MDTSQQNGPGIHATQHGSGVEAADPTSAVEPAVSTSASGHTPAEEPVAADTDSGGASASGDHGQHAGDMDVDDD